MTRSVFHIVARERALWAFARSRRSPRRPWTTFALGILAGLLIGLAVQGRGYLSGFEAGEQWAAEDEARSWRETVQPLDDCENPQGYPVDVRDYLRHP